MGNMWIIDVLSDLKTFAQLNGLAKLAAELDQTSEVAATELGVLAEAAKKSSLGNGAETGNLHWGTRTGG